MSNLTGLSVFMGQMQFKDCMKKISHRPRYRGIIIMITISFIQPSSPSADSFCPWPADGSVAEGVLFFLWAFGSIYLLFTSTYPQLLSEFFRILFCSHQSLLLRLLDISKTFFCSPARLDRMSAMQTCRPQFS